MHSTVLVNIISWFLVNLLTLFSSSQPLKSKLTTNHCAGCFSEACAAVAQLYIQSQVLCVKPAPDVVASDSSLCACAPGNVAPLHGSPTSKTVPHTYGSVDQHNFRLKLSKCDSEKLGKRKSKSVFLVNREH